ncbi:hypothetical protein, partial [Dokdonella sp.]|uniref:hypothetical protein n=1 Tax=Dokdonella sp. TaxID=2291710 RepID=UPI001B0149A2
NDDGANIYENPEGTGWLRMNEGGFLTQVDGAFLSTIRDDAPASGRGDQPRQGGNNGFITPIFNPVNLFGHADNGGRNDVNPAARRATTGPADHEGARANPNAARGGHDVGYYRNNPNYELRADGSYALKYKPQEHGDVFILGMRTLDDGTKVWE